MKSISTPKNSKLGELVATGLLNTAPNVIPQGKGPTDETAICYFSLQGWVRNILLGLPSEVLVGLTKIIFYGLNAKNGEDFRSICIEQLTIAFCNIIFNALISYGCSGVGAAIGTYFCPGAGTIVGRIAGNYLGNILKNVIGSFIYKILRSH